LSLPTLSTVQLDAGVAAALDRIPAASGVGQILGPDSKSLSIGKPANLRRWAATNLGAGKPPKKGARPPTDLSPVAIAVRFASTTSAFGQRLAFERLMARYVPLSARRDLKPPAYLHLDAGERFPRVTVRSLGPDPAALFGPFRDRRAADRAVQALHKAFLLRPCDYTFEPDPALPLGLGCLYAQVRSCVAPCLERVREDEYRALAERAATLLANVEGRGEDVSPWLPPWVCAIGGSRGLVVEKGSAGLELYPVLEQTVLDGESVTTEVDSLDAAVHRFRWEVGQPRPEDALWLSAWLHTPKRSGVYLAVPDEPTVDFVESVRAAVSP